MPIDGLRGLYASRPSHTVVDDAQVPVFTHFS
jgi:hypothetical protein